MALDVIRSLTDKVRIIIEPSDCLIAMRAQKPSDFASRVAMINCQTLCSAAHDVSLRSLANGAYVILRRKHGVVFVFGDRVSLDCVSKPRGNYADMTFFRMAVIIGCYLRAFFTRRLKPVRALISVFVKLSNRLPQSTFSACFFHPITNRPTVLGMMRVIWHRLTENPAALWSGFRGYRGNLAASAVTKMTLAHGESYNMEIR